MGGERAPETVDVCARRADVSATSRLVVGARARSRRPVRAARCSSTSRWSSSKKRATGDGVAAWTSSWATISALLAERSGTRSRWITPATVAARLPAAARAARVVGPVDMLTGTLPAIARARGWKWAGRACGASCARLRITAAKRLAAGLPIAVAAVVAVIHCGPSGPAATARSNGRAPAAPATVARPGGTPWARGVPAVAAAPWLAPLASTARSGRGPEPLPPPGHAGALTPPGRATAAGRIAPGPPTGQVAGSASAHSSRCAARRARQVPSAHRSPSDRRVQPRRSTDERFTGDVATARAEPGRRTGAAGARIRCSRCRAVGGAAGICGAGTRTCGAGTRICCSRCVPPAGPPGLAAPAPGPATPAPRPAAAAAAAVVPPVAFGPADAVCPPPAAVPAVAGAALLEASLLGSVVPDAGGLGAPAL